VLWAATVVGGAAAYAQIPVGATLPPDAIADRVVVEKATRVLTLLSGNRVLKTYPIRLGRNPSGAKTREGDGRTPEGQYLIDHRNPTSRFHLALHVSYPSQTDIARAAAARVPPGGDIMVHGLPNGLGWLGRLHQLFDWTNGCIAVTDREIEEIYRAVPDGTPIEIKS
jgi:murein L,D-transpeptidase YafK